MINRISLGRRLGTLFQKIEILILVLILFGYSWLIYRTAWINDDALITVRTVNNFIDGYGLRWNIDERVQTYTHPLWMLCILFLVLVTNDFFFSILYFSVLISTAAVSLLFLQKAGGFAEKIFSAFVLIFSSSFIDFSTSGLENPLSHLLLGLFIYTYSTVEKEIRRFAILALIACFATLNRLDILLIYLPVLIIAFPWDKPRKGICILFLCFSPFIMWELFSLFYYGFPLPNTAYAKLSLGPLADDYKATMGWFYLWRSFTTDPITLVVIGLTIILAIGHGDWFRLTLIMGVGIYIHYIIWIGGDFMNGRFLSAPLFVSAYTIATSRWLKSWKAKITLWPLVVAIGLLGRYPPVLTDKDYGKGRSRDDKMGEYGVHDERAVFFQTNSLRNSDRMNPYHNNHPWSKEGLRLLNSKSKVKVVKVIGHAGLFAGAEIHLVDVWALADPLLARLHPIEHSYGHYTRELPQGYLQTLATDTNHINDVYLAKYYDKLRLITRGNLFALKRLIEIWNINTGKYDYLLDHYSYMKLESLEVTTELTNPTHHPIVVAYVWNDWRKNSCIIDQASNLGKEYKIRWAISMDEIRLEPSKASEYPIQQSNVFCSFTPSLEESQIPKELNRQSTYYSSRNLRSVSLKPLVASGYKKTTQEFSRLRDKGVFTLSIAIKENDKSPIFDIYEYRYSYYVSDQKMFISRRPTPYSVHQFPHGRWTRGDNSLVIEQN